MISTPTDPEWYSSWRHEAIHELIDKNAQLSSEFNLGYWEQYDYDLNSGTLVFSHEGKPRVVATIQLVGTTSTKSSNWLWSWGNDWWPNAVTVDALATRQFGQQYGIYELITDYLTDESPVNLGWELTSVTARIVKAKGAYRPPGENGDLFLIYRDISFSQ